MRIQDPSSVTLTHRLAVGPVSLPDVLSYAMDLAVALRELHSDGRTHGAVSAEAVRLESGGAVLSAPSPQRPARTPAEDVAAFGAVLQAMLDALEAGGPADARAKLSELRAWCQGGPGHDVPGMQNVIVELRLAGMMARKSPVPMPSPPSPPMPAAPVFPAAHYEEAPSMPIPDYATPASFFGAVAPVEKPAPHAPQAHTGPVFRCPKCGSLDTRETPSRPLLHRVLAFVGVTYRCRACQARFLARRP